jgi:hypothetical membrane protein
VSWLARAGIVGPIWFTALVILQGALQPDYSHVAMPISALAAWPYGWMQRLNFWVFGVLMAANAIGLHRAVRPGPGGPLAPTLLLVSATGIVIAGVFSWVQIPEAGLTEPVGHVVGAVMTFLGAGSGLVALSSRLARDPSWRDLSRYTLACGTVILALFPVMGALAVPEGTPLHAVAGLLQRLVLVAWFPCIIVLSTRLLHVARALPQPA